MCGTVCSHLKKRWISFSHMWKCLVWGFILIPDEHRGTGHIIYLGHARFDLFFSSQDETEETAILCLLQNHGEPCSLASPLPLRVDAAAGEVLGNAGPWSSLTYGSMQRMIQPHVSFWAPKPTDANWMQTTGNTHTWRKRVIESVKEIETIC